MCSRLFALAGLLLVAGCAAEGTNDSEDVDEKPEVGREMDGRLAPTSFSGLAMEADVVANDLGPDPKR